MKIFLTRGIIIGASCGIFGWLAGFSDSYGRAVILGIFAGILAGFSIGRIQAKKLTKKASS